jgi:hypothetical protein
MSSNPSAAKEKKNKNKKTNQPNKQKKPQRCSVCFALVLVLGIEPRTLHILTR